MVSPFRWRSSALAATCGLIQQLLSDTPKIKDDVVRRPISRTDVIVTLNQLKTEGAIVSFRTNFFEKTADAHQIEVMPPLDSTLADTLRVVQDALEPFDLDLAVVVRLGVRSRDVA